MVVHKVGEARQRLREGNPVSASLPDEIDMVLQDIAQEFEVFDYTDIMNHNFTIAEIKKLRKLVRPALQEITLDDEEYQQIADKVAAIVLGKSESLTEGYDDGLVSIGDIERAISTLESLRDEMESGGWDAIQTDSSTSGLGQFYAAFPAGFIDLRDPYQYFPEDPQYGDSDESEYDEGLKTEQRSKYGGYDIASMVEDDIQFKVLAMIDPDSWDVHVAVEDDTCEILLRSDDENVQNKFGRPHSLLKHVAESSKYYLEKYAKGEVIANFDDYKNGVELTFTLKDEKDISESKRLKESRSTDLEDEIAEKVLDEVLPQTSDSDMWDATTYIAIGDEGQYVGKVAVSYTGEDNPDLSELDEISAALETALIDYAGENVRIDNISDYEVVAYFDLTEVPNEEVQ